MSSHERAAWHKHNIATVDARWPPITEARPQPTHREMARWRKSNRGAPQLLQRLRYFGAAPDQHLVLVEQWKPSSEDFNEMMKPAAASDICCVDADQQGFFESSPSAAITLAAEMAGEIRRASS